VKLENQKQEVVNFKTFLLRLGRYSIFSILLIVISLGIGTIGYHFFGELHWLDSFYMSSMILTGMGPIAEMKTTSSKLFSSFYAIYSGVAFLSITAVFFAPIVHRLLHILKVEGNDDNK
jgi:hypothetical protein